MEQENAPEEEEDEELELEPLEAEEAELDDEEEVEVDADADAEEEVDEEGDPKIAADVEESEDWGFHMPSMKEIKNKAREEVKKDANKAKKIIHDKTKIQESEE